MGLGTVVIFTYLYLFCDYFHKTYIKNDSPTRPKKVCSFDPPEEHNLKFIVLCGNPSIFVGWNNWWFIQLEESEVKEEVKKDQ